ncbi:MAG: zf-HC2 domain-containing protein [Candidatus Eremiobacteraeota bacterium]|nr:zf-HC2 domain-containing protein [Candidatus Eremiobacteraeota bacterium]
MKHLTNENIIDYIHDALTPEMDASAHAHLDECASCRDAYASEVALTEAFRAQARLEEREMPSLVKAAIWSAIREARPSWRTRFAAWMRPALALPIAALLIAAAYFGPGLRHTQDNGAPAIEAAYYLQDHAAMSATVPFGERAGANSSQLENQTAVYADETAVNVGAALYTADASH